MALQPAWTCTAGSSCHLDSKIGTVIAVASLSEGRHLLSLGDERLEDLIRVQVSLGERVLQSDGIPALELVVCVRYRLQ